ncbi:cytochrome-c family domain-containing protein (plasmid) [Rhizobium gallicum]|uniref:Cytochrome-c family domain-containing protein n=1 Tax=Rhizobium gallicum TaxID=56730 RepID=A0A1L5NTW8_9HYPH|nr:cytochrome-c family domain-containing protein [Rhizobium gallicum]
MSAWVGLVVSRGRVIGDVMYVHAPFPIGFMLSTSTAARKTSCRRSAENKNVYRNLDDIYVYLRARAFGDAPRGRATRLSAQEG